MEMRVLCLLLIAGSMAREDMDRNVFLFPRSSVADYVVLTPMVTGPLDKLTVCLRSYTEGGIYALLTVGTPESRICKAFAIFYNPTTKADILEWIHMCVTWDSDTGVLQLWVNGKVSPRRVVQKGFSIDLQDGISLGQMQIISEFGWYRPISHGNEWDHYTSFQGEISDVHMWNEVLSPETIRKVLLNNRDINGNVISWRSLNYTIKGDVTVQPKLQCRYDSESGNSHYQCSMD
ncbi:hypothetical protein XELAEV_18040324mg [Xenopus laevis]|uniref:Pentraxin family member n=1 Tax=Xenopus laevis TaxID=8355 RepID=A0A974H982_XENLA|nr:hypothetical protein XELAEV_18040324mg [Xenopus laevis]